MKNVAILGTGNIGTDLLIKLSKLGYTNLSFVGRREDSPNIQIAQKMGINTSSLGVKYFLENSNFNVVFDCTNALDAKENYDILKNLGIKVIDLTPAKLGDICVPCINGNDLATKDNINMITCGGQASLPAPFISAIISCITKCAKKYRVKIDFNNPLAGTDLHFEGTVLEVRVAQPEELDQAH